MRTAPDGMVAYVLDTVKFPPGAELALGNIADPVLRQGASLLKKARQRFVARVPLAEVNTTLIYKLFPLRNPISRLKYRKYAYREFLNMRQALSRGVSVPRPVAYIERRLRGFVVASGVVMEDLAGWTDLHQIALADGGNVLHTTRLATAPLLQLHQAGALHADVRNANILYAPDQERFSVIDWQHAEFHEPRSPWGLEHMAAHYIRKSASEARPALLEDWVPRLWQASDRAVDRPEFLHRVSTLLHRRPSTRARLKNRPLWAP